MIDALAKLLEAIPRPMQIMILSLLIGGAAVFGHETRYMTVADFTKSYVLDLKTEIRRLKKDMDKEEDQRVKAILMDQLDELLDELCDERPTDPYCTNR